MNGISAIRAGGLSWRTMNKPKAAPVAGPVRQNAVAILSNLQGMSAVTTMQALTLLDSLVHYDGQGHVIVPGTEKMGKRIDILALEEWQAKQLIQVKKG